MWNESQHPFAYNPRTASAAKGRPEPCDETQRVRGAAGKLRPYRDVRAGFEPWRRAALVAWASRDEAAVVN